MPYGSPFVPLLPVGGGAIFGGLAFQTGDDTPTVLDDDTISAAKPRRKPYKLADAKGMFLLVAPSGARYWRLKYRFHGREKSLSLGVFPAVPLTEARARRDAARATLAQGEDPSSVRQAERARARADARRRPGLRFQLSAEGRLTVATPAGGLTLSPGETDALRAFRAAEQKEEPPC